VITIHGNEKMSSNDGGNDKDDVKRSAIKRVKPKLEWKKGLDGIRKGTETHLQWFLLSMEKEQENMQEHETDSHESMVKTPKKWKRRFNRAEDLYYDWDYWMTGDISYSDEEFENENSACDVNNDDDKEVDDKKTTLESMLQK
jgi:hypothetical protein